MDRSDRNNREWLERERARAREVIEDRDALLALTKEALFTFVAHGWGSGPLAQQMRAAIAKAEKRTPLGQARDARARIDAARARLRHDDDSDIDGGPGQCSDS